MRNLVFSTLLALGASAQLDAAAFLERLPAQDVQLEELLRAPQAYMNLRVKFRCVFVEHGDLYDPIHTQYTPESYMNLVAWDDDARVWDPQVRAKPIGTMYIAKDRVATSHVGDLHKYELVEVTGEVSSAFRKQPWLTIHTIEPVKEAGSFTDNAVYHIEQANALAVDGSRDLAETHFDAAMHEHLPLNGKILVGELRARNLMAMGKTEQAGDLLRQALARSKPVEGDPVPVAAKDLALLHYELARVENDLAGSADDSSRADHFREAKRHAEQSVDLDPTMGDAYAVLGIAQAGLGDFETARKQCAIAIRMQPNNAETRWYLGRILDQQGQPDEAVEALKKAIDLTPKDARMHAALADAYLHRAQKNGPNSAADFGAAVREFDIAIRLKPNDVDLLLASGKAIEAAAAAKAEITVGNAKQPATGDLALERYKAAAAAAPDNLAGHLALARMYQQRGANDLAAEQLKAAIEIDPKDTQRQVEVARFYEAMDRKDDALAMYERIGNAKPKDADVQYRIGHLALQTGNADRAISALENTVKLKPKHVAALCDLAEVRLASGEPKRARKPAEAAVDAAQTPEERERANAVKAKVDEALKR